MNTTNANDASKTNDNATQPIEEVVQDVAADEADSIVGGGGITPRNIVETTNAYAVD